MTEYPATSAHVLDAAPDVEQKHDPVLIACVVVLTIALCVLGVELALLGRELADGHSLGLAIGPLLLAVVTERVGRLLHRRWKENPK